MHSGVARADECMNVVLEVKHVKEKVHRAKHKGEGQQILSFVTRTTFVRFSLFKAVPIVDNTPLAAVATSHVRREARILYLRWILRVESTNKTKQLCPRLITQLLSLRWIEDMAKHGQ